MRRREFIRVAGVVGFAAILGWRATPVRDATAPAPTAQRPTGQVRRDDRALDRGSPPVPEPDPAPPEPDEPEPDPAPPEPDEPEPDPAPPEPDETEPDPAPPEPDEPEEPPVANGIQVEVICRDALGLAAAAGAARRHTIERLTLHHTAVELGRNRNAPSRLRAHQRFHQDQGWSDIAYHYGVDARGNVYELRDPDVAGDTFTSYDPAGHFLVVCEGNYDLESPTDAMLAGVAQIMALGADRYDVDPATLTGHRDHAGTSCPGDALYARLDELRMEIGRLTVPAPTAVEVCGEPGRARVDTIEQA